MSWFGKQSVTKPSFTDLAPEGLTDLHSHVLPGLDDGARTKEEAIEMLEGLRTLGFTRVVSTPHFRTAEAAPSRTTQRRLINDIRESARGELPELLTGAETPFDERFIEAEANGDIPSVGNTSAYLIEFGFGPGGVPLQVENQVFKLNIAEKQLIVAHPERYADFQHHPERMAPLRSAGALFQLDILSLVGVNGARARDTSFRLLENHQVDLAATDVHRKEDLPAIVQALGALADWSPDLFKRLLSENPARVINGEPVESDDG